MAKLVDALDLGSSASRRGGSSPFIRTKLKEPSIARWFAIEGFCLFIIYKNFTALNITLDKKSTIEASIKVKLNEEDYQLKVEEKVKHVEAITHSNNNPHERSYSKVIFRNNEEYNNQSVDRSND